MEKKNYKINKEEEFFSDVSTNFTNHPDTRDLLRIKESNAIKRSIKSIILTDTYERPFSSIGGNIRRKLFENISDQTAESIKKDITLTIENYEPRALLKEIVVRPTSDDSYQVDIFFLAINSQVTEKLQLQLNKVR